MRIVRRAEWKARRPAQPPTMVSISSRQATCVHHDGDNPINVKTFAQACALMRTDQNYHMDGQHWSDIGYNFLVISAPGTDVDGLIFEGRGRDAIGAHCLNHNSPWIGIQVAIGGKQLPSPAALASVRWLHDTCATAARHDLAHKVHSDGVATECPGPILRAWVHAGMPTTLPEVDVPLTPSEIQAVAVEAADQVWNRFTVNGLTLQQVLSRLVAGSDPAVIAAAVVKALPGGSLDQAAIESAVRKVFADAAKTGA